MNNSVKTDDIIFNFFKQICDEKDDLKRIELGNNWIKAMETNLKNIELKEKSFSFEPEITIKLAKKKFKFFEVPITYNGRSYNEGKKIGLKDAFIAFKAIFIYSLKR